VKTSQTIAEISIFCDFEDGGRHHPGLMKNSKLSVHCRGLLCVNVPNFIKTGQTVAEIWRFNGFFFQNGGRPPSWICWARIWDHQQWLLGGLYLCAKFGWNRCSNFDNMKHETFNILPVWLENTYSHPKLGNNINETPKRQTPARVHVVWATKRVWSVGEFPKKV